MKKSNVLLLTAFLLVLAGIAVFAVHFRGAITEGFIKGDGNTLKEQRDVPAYSNIQIKGKYNIYYTQDSVNKVAVESDSNLLGLINTYVENDILKIYHNESIMPKTMNVYISYEKFEEIEIDGGSRFIAEKPVMFESINLTANSGSRFKLDGDFGKVVLEINAGSVANISGYCEDFAIIANAGSNLQSKELISNNVDIKATSGSTVEVHAINNLGVNASSGSTIYYHGNPELRNIQTSSGANLRRR